MLRIFSGDDEPVNELPEEEKKRLQTFVTYGGRKMDDLLRCPTRIKEDHNRSIDIDELGELVYFK